MHSKWAPCSLATFHPDPEIKIDDTIQMTLDQKKAISQSCPAKVFDVRQGIFQVVNQEKCIYCGQCKKTSETFDLITFRNFINIGNFDIYFRQKERPLHFYSRVGGTVDGSLHNEAVFSCIAQKVVGNQEQNRLINFNR